MDRKAMGSIILHEEAVDRPPGPCKERLLACARGPQTSGDQICTRTRIGSELQLKRAEGRHKMKQWQRISVRSSGRHAIAAMKSKSIPNWTAERRLLV
jgi:hypothetical protein